MKSTFTPKINWSLFNSFFLIENMKEGGDGFLFAKIENEMASSKKESTFDKFIDVCDKYRVKFTANQTTDGFEILIITNGRESQKLIYKNRKKDVTRELHYALGLELSIQMYNEEFLNDIKNSK